MLFESLYSLNLSILASFAHIRDLEFQSGNMFETVLIYYASPVVCTSRYILYV